MLLPVSHPPYGWVALRMTLSEADVPVLLVCSTRESSSHSSPSPLVSKVSDTRWPCNSGVHHVLFVPPKLMEKALMKLVGWLVQFKNGYEALVQSGNSSDVLSGEPLEETICCPPMTWAMVALGRLFER